MEDIGHKLMAFRIDEQLLGILYSQINQALEKLGATNTLNMEGKAVVELAFYLLSFGESIHGFDWVMAGTPGMQAVGLSVQSEATETTMPTKTVNLLRSALILSFLTVKWSTSKLQDMSTLGGWFAYPQDTLERRTEECLKIGRIAVKCVSVLSFVVFLCRGDYPDLLYRLANIGTARIGTQAHNVAGYNSAQLFVEGKKMLWLALLGASAAATIAIDWRSLRYYCYFYVRAVLSALHSIRNRGITMVSGTTTRSGVSTARQNSVLSYVQSLFTRPTQLDSAQADSTTTSNRTGHTVENSAHINSPQSDSTIRDSVLYTDGVTAPAVCSVCHTSSPEMPHRLDCGHIYCYMCVHRLVSTANGASNFDTSDSAATCVACFATVSKYEPLSPS